MVHLRILHAKNQHPRPKTVAYRPRTDRHTHRQTDRQRKQTLRTPFFDFFNIFDFLLKERSEKKNGLSRSLMKVANQELAHSIRRLTWICINDIP